MPPPNGCKNYFTPPCPEELILTDRIGNLTATYADFCLGHLLSCSRCAGKCADCQCSCRTIWFAQKKRASGMLWVLVGPHQARASCQPQVVCKACPASTQVLDIQQATRELPPAMAHVSSAKERGILAFPIACNCRNSTSGKKYQLVFWLCMMIWCVCTLPVFLDVHIPIPLPLFRGYLSETIPKIQYLLDPLELMQADQQGRGECAPLPKGERLDREQQTGHVTQWQHEDEPRGAGSSHQVLTSNIDNTRKLPRTT